MKFLLVFISFMKNGMISTVKTASIPKKSDALVGRV
jgi:hypothetical protein